MTKDKATGSPALVEAHRTDPTLATTSITIAGQEYRMCFDLGALAQAEQELNAPTKGRPNGEDVNLLFVSPKIAGLKLWNTRILFAASLHKFQPEIAWNDALALLTDEYIPAAVTAIIEAYRLGAPEPEKDEEDENPTEPGS